MDKVDNDTRMSGFESQFKVQSMELLSVRNIHSSLEYDKIRVKAYVFAHRQSFLSNNGYCTYFQIVTCLSIMACFLKPKRL